MKMYTKEIIDAFQEFAKYNELPLHPVMWLQSFSVQLQSDWQPFPKPGYLHGISHLLPVYPKEQSKMKNNIEFEMVQL